MAAAAKQERDNSIRLLEARVESFRALLESVGADEAPINLRKIKSQLNKLDNDYGDFVRAHNTYRNLAKLDGETLVADNTLFKKWYNLYDDLTDDASELLDVDETTGAPLNQNQKIEIAKYDLKAIQALITGHLDAAASVMDRGDVLNSANTIWLASEVDAAQSMLNKDLPESYTLLGQLEPAEIAAHFTNRKTFTDAQLATIFNLKKRITDEKNRLDARVTGGAAAPAPGAGGGGTSSGGSLHYKKRDFPTFSGSLEDFPTFRKRWTSTVAPHFSNEHQLDQILISVPAKDKTELKCCTDMKQVWDILDHKYGRQDVSALHFIDKFKRLEISGPTDHHKFMRTGIQPNSTSLRLADWTH